MPLRLRIVSDHRRRLGERSTIAFVDGGTIGRSAENDWVLPDPLRYVSAQHARIHRSEGHYVLEDVSSNGTFVNDESGALARRGPYRLKNGDLLRFGEYEIVVALEAEAAAPATPAASAAPVAPAAPGIKVDTADSGSQSLGPSRIEALLTVAPGQPDLGASLNLQALLPPDSSPSDSFRPVNAFGQAVSLAPEPLASQASDEVLALRRESRLSRLAVKRQLARASGIAPVEDVGGGLQAFCKGAGVDPQRLPGEAQSRLLHLAGLLLREMLVGVKDLDRVQQDLRNRFGIDIPTDPEDSRPRLRTSTIDDLLVDLLTQHESRRIDALQWARDAVDTVKSHEAATAQALRTAFLDFIHELDPKELDARFERSGAAPASPEAAAARRWELYRNFYRSLADMPGDKLPHTFVEAFATAYRAALKGAGTG